jgi:gas vesicle protein
MNKDVKNVGIALIAGLAAGYALGVLTAPKSGKETRNDIKDAGSKAYKAAEARLKGSYEDLSDVIAKASKQTKKLGTKGHEELDVLLAAAHDAQGRVKQLIASVRRGDATEEQFEDVVIAAQVAKDELQDFISDKK